MNNIKRLAELGQSVYVDEIRRSWMDDGTLQRFIDEDGIHGVTSNPAIFEKSITGTNDYDAAIAKHQERGDDAFTTYEALVIEDIQRAADLFLPLYNESKRKFGYISLEVSPELAHNAAGTIAEGKSLWERIDRPNVFIKVPATDAGIVAIEDLIAEGISVNVTLLFGQGRYKAAARAYIKGLRRRLEAGLPVSHVYSVASFFLSRIDVHVDALLGDNHPLRGKAAINYARLAWNHYNTIFFGQEFADLTNAGAMPQPLLWASTSSKDPAFSPVKYVEPLIGPGTVTTLPLETLAAYREHGEPKERIHEHPAEVEAVVAGLRAEGIDLEQVAKQLEDEGVEKFITPFRHLLSTLEQQLAEPR